MRGKISMKGYVYISSCIIIIVFHQPVIPPLPLPTEAASPKFCLPVNKLEEPLKAPQAAAAAAEQCPDYLAVGLLLHLAVDVFQDDSDHSYNGNDE